MYALVLQWKEFSVNLASVAAQATSVCGANFKGVSADDRLTLWFSNEPSAQDKAALQAYWGGLTLQSPEATTYVSQANIDEAIAELKATMIDKAWDDLTIAERKIFLGQQPTPEELGLL